LPDGDARQVSRRFCSTDRGSRPGSRQGASAQKSPGRSWPTCWCDGRAGAARLARALAQEYRLPFQAHIDENSLDSKLVFQDSDHYAKKNRLLPLSSIDGIVTIAWPTRPTSSRSDDLRILFGAQINVLMRRPESDRRSDQRAYDRLGHFRAEDLN